jgi:uncharacterized membrane protein YedE/YeeE
MRIRAVATGFGIVFGFVLCWATFANPEAIRRMLLLEDSYLFLMFACAVAVGSVGVRLLHRRQGLPLPVTRPEGRHVVGAAIFGLGWAISDACPGPVAAQLGRGFGWGLCTTAGIVIGIALYFRRQERAEETAATRDRARTTRAHPA